MPGTAGPRHGFVWGYSPGETTWGVGAFNPNFAKLEALLHLTVASITDTPPGTPTNGMVYIVGASPTGDWAGHANNVAAYYTVGTPAWLYIAPAAGVRAFNTATSTYWRFSGTAWVEEPASGDVSGPGSAVAGAVPVYADGTGKLLADSGVAFDDLLQIGAPLVTNNLITVDLVGRAIDSGVPIGGLGTGNVVGPAGSVAAGNLASYADTTGEVLADSGVPVADLILAGGTLVPGNLLTVDGSGDLIDTGVAVGDAGGGASVTVADAPPSIPAVGDLWWDSSDGGGQLYVYYDGFFVPASNQTLAGVLSLPLAIDAGGTGAVTAAAALAALGALPLTGGTVSGALSVGGVFSCGSNAFAANWGVGTGLATDAGTYGYTTPANGPAVTMYGVGHAGAGQMILTAPGWIKFASNTLPAVDNATVLGVAGTAFANVQAYGFTNSSDPSLKRSIETVPPGALAAVEALAPKSWMWRDGPDVTRRHYGFLAPDVRDVFGEGFGGWSQDKDTGLQSLTYSELVSVLWRAVQELSAKVAAMESAR